VLAVGDENFQEKCFESHRPGRGRRRCSSCPTRRNLSGSSAIAPCGLTTGRPYWSGRPTRC
jgi:hypothetical protein